MRRDVWLEIKRLKEVGLSARSIASELMIDRRTVARALVSETLPRRRPARGRPRVLDRHRGWIMGQLERYPRLSAMLLFGKLSAMGYEGGYGAVKDFVREIRPPPVPAAMTLRFSAGEMAQADWGTPGRSWSTGRVAGSASSS